MAKKRILLVDDEEPILLVMSAMLRAEGYDVEATAESDQGAEKVRQGTYDLLISDVRMSPIDGIELSRIAKAHNARMPVILVTAYDSEDAQREARMLGVAAYLRKPFDSAEVVEIVRGILNPASKKGPA